MRRKSAKKVILLIIAAFCLTAFAQLKKVDGSSKISYTKVTVYPGDTLWKIASKYNTDESDIRKKIYKIRKLNDLNSAIIMPGQELIIPLN
jgi:LysM repeat protein